MTKFYIKFEEGEIDVETNTGYFLNVLVYWFVVLLYAHHEALRRTIN